MTIHCVGLEMNLTMSNGFFHRRMEMASKTMFLANVSAFVSFRASPKQPQSLTGLAITIHAVMNVITAITNSKTLEVSLLLMANNKNIPMENSKVERPMEAVSVSQSGMTPPNPRACR